MTCSETSISPRDWASQFLSGLHKRGRPGKREGPWVSEWVSKQVPGLEKQGKYYLATQTTLGQQMVLYNSIDNRNSRIESGPLGVITFLNFS